MVKKKILFLSFFILSSQNFIDESINDISIFFENFKSLSANFIQTNNTGDHVYGTLKIQKPNKINIKYTESNQLIVGDGKKLAIINKKYSQINFYNYDQLPFKIFLSDNFSLDNYSIIDYEKYDNIIEIELSPKNDNKSGSIKLIFENNPIILKKWVLKEYNGSKIEVFLSEVEMNNIIKDEYFKIVDPRKIPFGNP